MKAGKSSRRRLGFRVVDWVDGSIIGPIEDGGARGAWDARLVVNPSLACFLRACATVSRPLTSPTSRLCVGSMASRGRE